MLRAGMRGAGCGARAGEPLRVIAAELGWSPQALAKRLRNGMPGTYRTGNRPAAARRTPRARIAEAAASIRAAA